MDDYAFRTEGLVKRFGGTTARAGTVLGVLGSNGAGKPATAAADP